MGIVQRWVASSSPLVKVLMGISIISMVVVGNKLYISPFFNKQRYLRNEEWATTIIDAEESTGKQ